MGSENRLKIKVFNQTRVAEHDGSRIEAKPVLAQNSFFSSNDQPEPNSFTSASAFQPAAFTVSSTCPSHDTLLEANAPFASNRKPRSRET
jgi:hypothetical protein